MKELPASYGTWRFITIFITDCHFLIFWARVPEVQTISDISKAIHVDIFDDKFFNKYHSELSSNDMLFILSFMKTVQLVSVISEFESEWVQTEPYSLLCYSYGSEEQGIYGTWTCKQERNPCVILCYIQVL